MRQDNNHNFMANKLIEKNPISKKKKLKANKKEEKKKEILKYSLNKDHSHTRTALVETITTSTPKPFNRVLLLISLVDRQSTSVTSVILSHLK